MEQQGLANYPALAVGLWLSKKGRISGPLKTSISFFSASTPDQRAGQAGRAALARYRNRVDLDHMHLAAGRFHALPGLRIALHHDDLARRDCEHIAAHASEFAIRHLDEIHALGE